MIIVFGSKKILFLIPAFLPETPKLAPVIGDHSITILSRTSSFKLALAKLRNIVKLDLNYTNLPDTVVFIRYFDLVWPRRVRCLLFWRIPLVRKRPSGSQNSICQEISEITNFFSVSVVGFIISECRSPSEEGHWPAHVSKRRLGRQRQKHGLHSAACGRAS